MALDFIGWFVFFVFKQKTAYEIRPCDWSSDVCSSDLAGSGPLAAPIFLDPTGHHLLEARAQRGGVGATRCPAAPARLHDAIELPGDETGEDDGVPAVDRGDKPAVGPRGVGSP